jgi:cytochrome b561
VPKPAEKGAILPLSADRTLLEHHQPADYSKTQIVLHWTVAALIIVQLLLHDGMEHAWDTYEDTGTTEIGPLVVLHIAVGVSILLLAIWRISLRVTRGAPPLPEDHPALLKFVAHANHYLLYALLIAMPLAGASAWFFGIEAAADIHELGKNLLLILVGLHIAGGLAEHFILKSNVLRRMLGLQAR